MTLYVDATRRGRVAQLFLGGYILVQLGETLVAGLTPSESPASGLAALVLLAMLIATVVATAMWIYRINANAHGFAYPPTITPGWNVGWFFVPFANLWKPFEGIKQVWQASAGGDEWSLPPVPSILYGWWGCWLTGNIVSNISLRLGGAADPSLTRMIEAVAAALLIGAAALLIRIIALLSAMQVRAHAATTFD